MEHLNSKQQLNYNNLLDEIYDLDIPADKKLNLIKKVDNVINSITTKEREVVEVQSDDEESVNYTEYCITLFDKENNGQELASYKSKKVAVSQFYHLLEQLKTNRSNAGYELELTATPYKDDEIQDGMEVLIVEKIK